MGEVGFRVREQPVVELETLALSNAVFQAILQAFRDCDYAIALGRLGRGDDVPAAYPQIVLVDHKRRLLKVDIHGRQRQQFAFPYAGVVQRHKDGARSRLVRNGLSEGVEFILRPEQHLISLFLAHTARLVAEVLLRSVILHRVIEDGDQLVVYRLEIRSPTAPAK